MPVTFNITYVIPFARVKFFVLNYYFSLSGYNYCYTVIVVHTTRLRAIPQRRGSESGTVPLASESGDPVPDSESRGPVHSETLPYLLKNYSRATVFERKTFPGGRVQLLNSIEA